MASTRDTRRSGSPTSRVSARQGRGASPRRATSSKGATRADAAPRGSTAGARGSARPPRRAPAAPAARAPRASTSRTTASRSNGSKATASRTSASRSTASRTKGSKATASGGAASRAGASAGRRRRSSRPAENQQSLLEAPAPRPPDPEAGFRGPQVCALVGISYRQLDYWARTGLLCPSVATAHGSGSKRGYSYRDLVQLKVIKQLLDAGVSLRSARRAIECLRANLGDDLASANLVLTGTRSVLARTDGEVVDLLAGGQGVFNIVPLSGVVGELDADIVRIGAEAHEDPPAQRPGRPPTARAAGVRRAAGV